MKKIIAIFLLAIGFSSYSQTKIGNIELPNEMVVQDFHIQLQGAGTRVKLWMDMYAMGLYLSNKTNQAETIIAKDEPMGIRLEIVSGLITSEKMEKATREGFQNATEGKIKPIEKEIDEFISVFLGGIKKNDVFEFVYLPAKGTLIYKNGELKKEISGLSFKKALFGIWLCNKPADKNLKEDLLK